MPATLAVRRNIELARHSLGWVLVAALRTPHIAALVVVGLAMVGFGLLLIGYGFGWL